MAYRRPIEQRPAEEEIPEDLIATIPDVGGQPIPLEVVTDDPPPSEIVTPSAFAATLADVRRHFEETMQQELSLVESQMGAALAGLAEALQQREIEILAARQELDQLRAANEVSERKLQALKAALSDA